MREKVRQVPFGGEWSKFCIAYVALNAPYWLIGHWFYMSRPLFNVELVIPLLLAAGSPRAAVLALAILWSLDLTVSQALSYHFTSPLEFVRSSQFLSDVHIGRLLSTDRVLIGLLFIGSAAAVIWWTPRRGRAPWWPALGVTMLLCVLDIVNGSSMVSRRGTRLVAFNVANSPALTLGMRAWKEQQPTLLGLIPARGSATSIANLANWAAAHPDGGILVVIVESLGWHTDDGMRAWLRDELITEPIAARYDIREEPVQFRGSTTSAELRELCGLYGSYRSLHANEGQKCLPAQLVKQGWKTTGIHGFSSHMFDRQAWWPTIGLQTRLFAQDIVTPASRQCGGAFAGVCDSDLLARAIAEARGPRRMVYALTLNSHLPLANIEVPAELQRRCDASHSGQDVCRLSATLGAALRSLRDNLIVTGASPAIVVVGDHGPPFAALSDRNQYAPTQVPAFILTPK